VGVDTVGRDAAAARRRTLRVCLALLVGVTVIVGGAWAMASTFESPAQREAAAAAPTPGPVTARVQRGDLTRTVSFPGTVATADRAAYTIPPRDGERAVVTGTALREGATVSAGDVVTEINGRPVFATSGQFGFYRDLRPGESGPDVEQLQRSLMESGLLSSADGDFGAATERAVRRLYDEAGYSVPGISDDSGGTTAPTPSPPEVPGSDEDPATGTATVPDHRATARTALEVPTSEFLVLGELPARIATVPHVGAVIDGESSVAVERGALRIESDVPALSAADLETGQEGTFTGARGTTASVRLQSIGETSDDSADVSVLSTGVRELPAGSRGETGTIAVTLDVVAKNSLLVPTIAVSTGGKGTAHVLVRRDDHYERVPVRELGQLEGTSAVEVLDGSDLEPGEEVRVS